MNPLNYLPYLKEFYEKGIILKYDTQGFTRELTTEEENEIKKLEGSYVKYGLKVIAVIDGIYSFEGERVEMLSYIYIDKETKPWVIDDKEKIVGFMAKVINKTWDIEESGSIGVKEVAGLLKRIY